MKEEDPNYVAKLEKAIKQKYGEEAIQNPAKMWNEEKEKDYLQQLRVFVEKQKSHDIKNEPENVNGILISRKLFNKGNINNCPVCEKRIRKIDDDIYITKFECCARCYIEYIDGREERWLKGWRPKNVTRSS